MHGDGGDGEYDPQAVFADIAQGLLSRVDLSESDEVLDVACGAWVVGREAHRRGTRRVAGVDVNLSRLRTGVSRTACQARAEALPFVDGAFSLVTCQHGLMFFDDRAAALREARRVLRAQGRFAATCWCAIDENPGFLALHRAIAEQLGPDAARAAARPFSLPDAERVSAEITEAGFSDPSIGEIDLRITSRSAEAFASWYLRRTSVAPFLEGREEAIPIICRHVAEDLTAYQEPDRVDMPVKAYCVQARLLA